MTKREYCQSRESVAYYSGLNGLEIKGIEYGIDDFLYCVSGAWGRAEKIPPFEDSRGQARPLFCPLARVQNPA